VLGFDVGGLPDIVVDAAKQLAPPCDADALAKMAGDILQDETAICELRARTRQHAEELFSLPVCVARHVALYESLMSPRSS
jgi:glycosyltransferase involved in cell wall biosynthesis